MASGAAASAAGGPKSAASTPEAPQNEEALREVFRKFDTNRDGKMQETEFTKLMQSLGSFSSEEIKSLFDEARGRAGGPRFARRGGLCCP